MKNFMRIFIVLMGFLLCTFTHVSAKVFKVSTQEEFNKAAEASKAGDEIVISNGNYSGWELSVHANGEDGKPILIRAETSGKVVFSGDAAKPMILLKGSYTEISGLVFSGCNVFRTKESKGVLIELMDTKSCRITDCIFTKNSAKSQYLPIVVVSGNGRDNRVDHCSFIGNIDNQELQVKISADVPLNTLIDHNLFKDKDKLTWKGSNGGECVQIGQDQIAFGMQYPRSVVRDNRFIRCNGEGEVISNKCSGNQYINNYFEDCHGELVMRGGHDCLIDSNIFKGGSGGIRISGTHHTITNNRLNGQPTAIRLMFGMAKGKTDIGFYIAASDCLIKNNQITGATTGILIGDGKNADWTGKFDTTKYPSPVMQNVAPFNNTFEDNTIVDTKIPVVHNEN